MKCRLMISLLLAAFVWPHVLFAQVSDRRPLVAILLGGSSTNATVREVLNGFAEQMRELGYITGRNIEFVYRYGDGDLTRMPELAKELALLRPAVFITATYAGTVAVKQEAPTVPIVNPALTDPEGFGLVSSQARPGGQVTGIMATLDSLLVKQLQLALEIVPGATKVGMLVNASNAGNAFHLRTMEEAAKALGVSILSANVRLAADIEPAIQMLAQQHAELLLIIPEALFLIERKQIVALASAAHLPALYSNREHAEEGGLMSYGTNIRVSWRRAAQYVDKILQGANPGDLPVEFPTRLELIVNLKTAKALGLTVPPTLLARADEVIE